MNHPIPLAADRSPAPPAAKPSNETEISCGGRESGWPAVKAFESSQKLIARLPAVGFIDWLDVGVFSIPRWIMVGEYDACQLRERFSEAKTLTCRGI